MKKTISLKLQPSDAWSAEELGIWIRHAKSITLEVVRAGVGLAIIKQLDYANLTTPETLEFMDSEPKASQSTTDLPNRNY